MFRILVAVACICVVSDTNAQELRIAGGNYAKEGEIPYIATILLCEIHYCGGSIITEKYILSAGHCFDNNYSLQFYSVRVGSLDYRSGGSKHDVDNVINHPSYKKELFTYIYNETYKDASVKLLHNDISIVRVTPNIQFTATVKPIELWDSTVETNIKVKASGWGSTGYNKEISKYLKYDYYNLPAYHWLCRVNDVFIEYQNLCTFSKRLSGCCSGDSGGPLVYKNYLIGVVSLGGECERGYTVYTNVSNYVKWISTVILDSKQQKFMQLSIKHKE